MDDTLKYALIGGIPALLITVLAIATILNKTLAVVASREKSLIEADAVRFEKRARLVCDPKRCRIRITQQGVALTLFVGNRGVSDASDIFVRALIWMPGERKPTDQQFSFPLLKAGQTDELVFALATGAAGATVGIWLEFMYLDFREKKRLEWEGYSVNLGMTPARVVNVRVGRLKRIRWFRRVRFSRR